MSIDIEALYRKYGPMVFRRCLGLLKDEELAADAMQDAFMQVLRRRNTLTSDYPSSLMYRIATNVSINALRRRKRARIAGNQDLMEEIASGEDIAEVSAARSVLDRIFGADDTDASKTSTRTIAVLHYVDGLTLDETAEIAGMSVSGVRKRLRTLKAKSLALRAEKEL